jgi:lipopolysaccharide/colanic/teichoic acid biosynthesis glycosyltransferase
MVQPGTGTPPATARIPAWKRVFDVTCVLAALPVLIPAGIVIAVFIKIVSPGPAFFRQQRVGYLGRRFMCLKFRTMKVNADTSVHQAHLRNLVTGNGPTRKLDCGGDSRLIRGGLLLRSLGADELPQLINVLRGEMSLVGPRPCTPYEFELFSAPHKRRCHALPGLTGSWQISGKNKTTFEEMMNLDLGYVEHSSLWLDLKIILLTLPAVLALVWEMRIQPKLARRRAARAAQRAKPDFEQPAERPFAGTVPARK